MEITFSLENIDDVAQKVIEANPYKVILFYGEMGAGKTTFIKALARTLGVKNNTGSPTFSLVNEYELENGLLYHFDVYRLKNEAEALDFGIEDYLYSGHWCCIEWAEKIPNLIPDKHSIIELKVLENGERKLILN